MIVARSGGTARRANGRDRADRVTAGDTLFPKIRGEVAGSIVRANDRSLARADGTATRGARNPLIRASLVNERSHLIPPWRGERSSARSRTERSIGTVLPRRALTYPSPGGKTRESTVAETTVPRTTLARANAVQTRGGFICRFPIRLRRTGEFPVTRTPVARMSQCGRCIHARARGETRTVMNFSALEPPKSRMCYRAIRPVKLAAEKAASHRCANAPTETSVVYTGRGSNIPSSSSTPLRRKSLKADPGGI